MVIENMEEFIMIHARSNQKIGSDTIAVSADLARNLQIENKQFLQVGVSTLRKKLKVKILNNGKYLSSIYLAPTVLRRLYLSSGRKYGANFNGEELRFGPVVGVMAEVVGENGRPFGPQSYFIKQLITNGRKFGQICFGFSPFSINWASRTVTGYTYGSKGWVKRTYPMPEVVYPRERGYSATINRIRNRMEAHGVKLLNPKLIGKWQTHKILSQNPDLLPFIPETQLITNFGKVGTMIKKYRGVYLKPVTGSQGKNIIKVTHKKGSGYEYHYLMNNQVHHGRAATLQQLRQHLYRVMGNRRYIVQKQINLIRTRGNILDVRVMVQKDNRGRWGITGMAVRVGKHGAITSNISSGGYGRRVRGVLESKFASREKVDEIIQQIEQVALKAASTLEQGIGNAGEMGIDIGIDQNGRVWFIEANLRPARQVFTLIGDTRTRIKSVQTPLLYARHLAKFE